MAKWSKRDYVAVADVIRDVEHFGVPGGQADLRTTHAIADGFADLFARDNDRFDRARFLCYIETGHDRAPRRRVGS